MKYIYYRIREVLGLLPCQNKSSTLVCIFAKYVKTVTERGK